MIHFTIAAPDSNRHERSAEIARAVLDTTDRTVSEIEVGGVEPLLVEFVDEESVDRLRDAGVSVTDDTLDGTVEATPETVEAVLSLFSGGLLTARFVDPSGEEIFARHDTDAESCYLTETEYEALCETLDFELLTQLQPFGDSVPTDQFGSLKANGLMKCLVRYPSTTDTPSGRTAFETLLDSTERTVETIELFGVVPLLERVDADSVATLVENGATYDGIRLVGTVPASPASIDAIVALFSDALLRVVTRDSSERPLFVREQPELNYVFLTESEYDRLQAVLDDASLEVLD